MGEGGGMEWTKVPQSVPQPGPDPTTCQCRVHCLDLFATSPPPLKVLENLAFLLFCFCISLSAGAVSSCKIWRNINSM